MSSDTPTMQPILICGHQRSGTTLLASLLDGHPDLAVFPYETWLLLHGATGKFRGASPTEIVSYVLAHCHGWSEEKQFDYEKFVGLLHQSLAAPDRPVNTLGGLMELLSRCYARAGNCAAARYWVEKSPLNELRLPIVKKEFPGLKAVYIVRDPREVYLSWKRKREKETDRAQTFTVEQIARSWAKSLAAWEEYMAAYGDGLMVRYVDLVSYPALSMQRVCDYLGIRFEESLLQPTQMGAVWQGNSSYANNRRTVNTASVGRWRRELTPFEIEQMDAFCGAAMLRLGFSAQKLPAKKVVRAFIRGKSELRLKLQLLAALGRLYYPYSSRGPHTAAGGEEPRWYRLETAHELKPATVHGSVPEVTSS